MSHDRDFLDRTVTRTLAYEGAGKWQIYAGGYSDMIAQRGVGVQARKADKAAKPKSKTNTPAAQGKPSANKLSYKHKFRLDSLPAEMEKIEAEIAGHNQALSDPELYTKDPGLFTRTSNALVEAQTTLAACEEEWLELEMLREDTEG